MERMPICSKTRRRSQTVGESCSAAGDMPPRSRPGSALPRNGGEAAPRAGRTTPPPPRIAVMEINRQLDRGTEDAADLAQPVHRQLDRFNRLVEIGVFVGPALVTHAGDEAQVAPT